MEKFENFEIQNQEVIFGGDLSNTTYTDGAGNRGFDKNDSDMDRVIYLEKAPRLARASRSCQQQ